MDTSNKSFIDFQGECSFDFESTDLITGITYKGKFTAKRPNIGAQFGIQRDIGRIKLDVPFFDNNNEMILFMWAYCKNTIVDFPKWYEDTNYLQDLFDRNMIMTLYNKIQDGFDPEGKEKKAQSEEEYEDKSE